MDALIGCLRALRTWPALAGLSLALGTGLATSDAGGRIAAPTAALAVPLSGISWSIDRLPDAAQTPGAVDPDLLARILTQPPQNTVARSLGAPPQAPAPDPAAAAHIQQGYGRLPMHFEPNQGQSADEVRYLARGAGYGLFLTETEAVLVLRRGRAAGTAGGPEADAPAGADSQPRSLFGKPAFSGPFSPLVGNPSPEPSFPLAALGREGRAAFAYRNTPAAYGEAPNAPDPLPGSHSFTSPRHPLPDRLAAPEPSEPPQTAVVRMRLEGATRNPAPRVTGLERQRGISNYYLGNEPAKWHSGVPHYAKVQYDQVYPGIDLVYYGNPRQLEYDLVVAPGADPGQIRLSFAGVDGMRIDGEGNLVLAVAGGEIVQQAPRVFQLVEGQERLVAGRYVMLDEGGASAAGEEGAAILAASPVLGIALASYDTGRPLVIDPVVVYSTYLGGSSGDAGYGIAVDGAGNAYITGLTYSTDFPIVDARYPNYGGAAVNGHAFVTKFDLQGQGPVYSTYLGGSSNELGIGIALDGVGNVYVTGCTTSADFPTVNARYPIYGGGGDWDAFVTKFDPRGQGPVYSTYLGGSSRDMVAGIAVDGAGNAYVTGSTDSADFPTVNARYPKYVGNTDAFVTKFNPQGQPVYSTYLSGIYMQFYVGFSVEHGKAIAVDGTGNAYITGETNSTDFPTVNALYPTNRGGYDAFVTKFDPQGQGPIYSTYLGGSSDDSGTGIAVDGAGNAYITGETTSTNFPPVNARYPNSTLLPFPRI